MFPFKAQSSQYIPLLFFSLEHLSSFILRGLSVIIIVEGDTCPCLLPEMWCILSSLWSRIPWHLLEHRIPHLLSGYQSSSTSITLHSPVLFGTSGLSGPLSLKHFNVTLKKPINPYCSTYKGNKKKDRKVSLSALSARHSLSLRQSFLPVYYKLFQN